MKKIPVGATIAHAYRFAFGNFFKILAVMWPTWLLLMVPAFFTIRQMPAFMAGMAAHDPSAIAAYLPTLLLSYAVMLVVLVVQFAGLNRLALGLPMPSSYFYFSLGKPVWRLLGAFLLAFLILFAVILIAGIAGGFLAVAIAVATGGSAAGTHSAGLAVVAFTMLIYGAMIYGVVRLTFLLSPVVIAEERIGLRRAWQLGRGNFWRIFLILLALTLPLAVLEGVWFYGPWGPGLPPMMAYPPTPEMVAAQQQATAQWMQHFIGYFTAYWYLIFPLSLAISALFYGGIVAAQGFAYRAVTDDMPEI